jgi:hypothetical protein
MTKEEFIKSYAKQCSDKDYIDSVYEEVKQLRLFQEHYDNVISEMREAEARAGGECFTQERFYYHLDDLIETRISHIMEDFDEYLVEYLEAVTA